MADKYLNIVIKATAEDARTEIKKTLHFIKEVFGVYGTFDAFKETKAGAKATASTVNTAYEGAERHQKKAKEGLNDLKATSENVFSSIGKGGNSSAINTLSKQIKNLADQIANLAVQMEKIQAITATGIGGTLGQSTAFTTKDMGTSTIGGVATTTEDIKSAKKKAKEATEEPKPPLIYDKDIPTRDRRVISAYASATTESLKEAQIKTLQQKAQVGPAFLRDIQRMFVEVQSVGVNMPSNLQGLLRGIPGISTKGDALENIQNRYYRGEISQKELRTIKEGLASRVEDLSYIKQITNIDKAKGEQIFKQFEAGKVTKTELQKMASLRYYEDIVGIDPSKYKIEGSGKRILAGEQKPLSNSDLDLLMTSRKDLNALKKKGWTPSETKLGYPSMISPSGHAEAYLIPEATAKKMALKDLAAEVRSIAKTPEFKQALPKMESETRALFPERASQITASKYTEEQLLKMKSVATQTIATDIANAQKAYHESLAKEVRTIAQSPEFKALRKEKSTEAEQLRAMFPSDTRKIKADAYSVEKLEAMKNTAESQIITSRTMTAIEERKTKEMAEQIALKKNEQRVVERMSAVNVAESKKWEADYRAKKVSLSEMEEHAKVMETRFAAAKAEFDKGMGKAPTYEYSPKNAPKEYQAKLQEDYLKSQQLIKDITKLDPKVGERVKDIYGRGKTNVEELQLMKTRLTNLSEAIPVLEKIKKLNHETWAEASTKFKEGGIDKAGLERIHALELSRQSGAKVAQKDFDAVYKGYQKEGQAAMALIADKEKLRTEGERYLIQQSAGTTKIINDYKKRNAITAEEYMTHKSYIEGEAIDEAKYADEIKKANSYREQGRVLMKEQGKTEDSTVTANRQQAQANINKEYREAQTLIKSITKLDSERGQILSEQYEKRVINIEDLRNAKKEIKDAESYIKSITKLNTEQGQSFREAWKTGAVNVADLKEAKVGLEAIATEQKKLNELQAQGLATNLTSPAAVRERNRAIKTARGMLEKEGEYSPVTISKMEDNQVLSEGIVLQKKKLALAEEEYIIRQQTTTAIKTGIAVELGSPAATRMKAEYKEVQKLIAQISAADKELGAKLQAHFQAGRPILGQQVDLNLLNTLKAELDKIAAEKQKIIDLEKTSLGLGLETNKAKLAQLALEEKVAKAKALIFAHTDRSQVDIDKMTGREALTELERLQTTVWKNKKPPTLPLGFTAEEMRNTNISNELLKEFEKSFNRVKIAAESSSVGIKKAQAEIVAFNSGQSFKGGRPAVGFSEQDVKIIQDVASKSPRAREMVQGLHLDIDKTVGPLAAYIDSVKRMATFQLQFYGGMAAIFGALAVIKDAFTSALDLEQTLKNIQAVTDITDKQTKALGQSFLEISKVVPYAANELAKLALQLSYAGVDADKLAMAVSIASKVATISGEDMKQVAFAIATVIQAWHYSAEDMEEIGNIVAVAFNKSRMTVDDMGTALNYIAGLMSSVNMPFKEVAATMSVISNLGVRASTLATGWRQFISDMLSPTAKLGAWLRSVNADMSKLDPTQIKGPHMMVQILTELERVGMDTKKAFDLLQVRGASFFTFLKQAGAEKILDMEKMMGDTDALQRAVDTTMEGPINAFKNAWNTIKSSFMIIFSEFTPAFVGFAKIIKVLAVGIADLAGLISTIPGQMMVWATVIFFVIATVKKLTSAIMEMEIIASATTLGRLAKIAIWIAAISGLGAIIERTIQKAMGGKSTWDKIDDLEKLTNAQSKQKKEVQGLTQGYADLEKQFDAVQSGAKGAKEAIEAAMSRQANEDWLNTARTLDKIALIKSGLEGVRDTVKEINIQTKKTPPDEWFDGVKKWFSEKMKELGVDMNRDVRLAELGLAPYNKKGGPATPYLYNQMMTAREPQPIVIPTGSTPYETGSASGIVGGGQKQTIINFVQEKAPAFGLDPALVLGLFQKESSLNPYAENKGSGAAGLAQFMPDTARMYGVKDVYDWEQSAIGAMQYLADLFRKFKGDANKVLATYGGHVTADPTEYIASINEYAEKFRKGKAEIAEQEESIRLGGPRVTTPLQVSAGYTQMATPQQLAATRGEQLTGYWGMAIPKETTQPWMQEAIDKSAVTAELRNAARRSTEEIVKNASKKETIEALQDALTTTIQDIETQQYALMSHATTLRAKLEKLEWGADTKENVKAIEETKIQIGQADTAIKNAKAAGTEAIKVIQTRIDSINKPESYSQYLQGMQKALSEEKASITGRVENAKKEKQLLDAQTKESFEEEKERIDLAKQKNEEYYRSDIVSAEEYYNTKKALIADYDKAEKFQAKQLYEHNIKEIKIEQESNIEVIMKSSAKIAELQDEMLRQPTDPHEMAEKRDAIKAIEKDIIKAAEHQTALNTQETKYGVELEKSNTKIDRRTKLQEEQLAFEEKIKKITKPLEQELKIVTLQKDYNTLLQEAYGMMGQWNEARSAELTVATSQLKINELNNAIQKEIVQFSINEAEALLSVTERGTALYETRKKQLDILKEEYQLRGLIGDVQKKVDEQKAKDIADPLTAGLRNATSAWTNYTKNVVDLMVGMYEDISKAGSDIFFDAVKGQLKSIGDYFKSLTDRILRYFTDLLARMAAEALVKPILIQIATVFGGATGMLTGTPNPVSAMTGGGGLTGFGGGSTVGGTSSASNPFGTSLSSSWLGRGLDKVFGTPSAGGGTLYDSGYIMTESGEVIAPMQTPSALGFTNNISYVDATSGSLLSTAPVATSELFGGSSALGTTPTAEVFGGALNYTPKEMGQAIGSTQVASPGISALGYAAAGLGAAAGAYGVFNAYKNKDAFGGAMSGATMGASIGSIIPGIGTIVGGVIGGVVGLLAGLFGEKKRPPSMNVQYNPGQRPDIMATEQGEKGGFQNASIQGAAGVWSVNEQQGIPHGIIEPLAKMFSNAADHLKTSLSDIGLDTSGFEKKWFKHFHDLGGKSQQEIEQIMRDTFGEYATFVTGIDFAKLKSGSEDIIATIDRIIGAITSIGKMEKLDVGQMFKDIDLIPNTAKDKIKTDFEDLTKAIDKLPGLSGEEWGNQLATVGQLSAQAYDDLKAYLTYLKQSMQELKDDARTMHDTLALDKMTEMQKTTFYMKEFYGTIALIGEEEDPEKLAKLWQRYKTDFNNLYGSLKAFIDKVKALGQSFADTLDQMKMNNMTPEQQVSFINQNIGRIDTAGQAAMAAYDQAKKGIYDTSRFKDANDAILYWAGEIASLGEELNTWVQKGMGLGDVDWEKTLGNTGGLLDRWKGYMDELGGDGNTAIGMLDQSITDVSDTISTKLGKAVDDLTTEVGDIQKALDKIDFTPMYTASTAAGDFATAVNNATTNINGAVSNINTQLANAGGDTSGTLPGLNTGWNWMTGSAGIPTATTSNTATPSIAGTTSVTTSTGFAGTPTAPATLPPATSTEITTTINNATNTVTSALDNYFNSWVNAFGGPSGYIGFTPQAKGGFYDKPTYIPNMIVGEAGPEYILPEKKLKSLIKETIASDKELASKSEIKSTTDNFKSEKLKTEKTVTPFAQGGFFSKPTIISNALVGEAGPEYIIPESKMKGLIKEISREKATTEKSDKMSSKEKTNIAKVIDKAVADKVVYKTSNVVSEKDSKLNSSVISNINKDHKAEVLSDKKSEVSKLLSYVSDKKSSMTSDVTDKVTAFATGGFFNKPTYISNALVGEAGAEYIISENNLKELISKTTKESAEASTITSASKATDISKISDMVSDKTMKVMQKEISKTTADKTTALVSHTNKDKATFISDKDKENISNSISDSKTQVSSNTTTAFAKGGYFEKATFVPNVLIGEAGPEYNIREDHLISTIKKANEDKSSVDNSQVINNSKSVHTDIKNNKEEWLKSFNSSTAIDGKRNTTLNMGGGEYNPVATTYNNSILKGGEINNFHGGVTTQHASNEFLKWGTQPSSPLSSAPVTPQATGGFFNKPTLIPNMLIGEAGAEYNIKEEHLIRLIQEAVATQKPLEVLMKTTQVSEEKSWISSVQESISTTAKETSMVREMLEKIDLDLIKQDSSATPPVMQKIEIDTPTTNLVDYSSTRNTQNQRSEGDKYVTGTQLVNALQQIVNQQAPGSSPVVIYVSEELGSRLQFQTETSDMTMVRVERMLRDPRAR